MTTSRRSFLRLAAGTGVLPAWPRAADAQAYPARPVRVLVAVSPGGTTDLAARLMAQWLAKRLGQPFVIENRPGGATNIFVYRACAIFEQAVRFGANAIKVLCSVADSIVVDLDLKTRDHRFPRRITRIESRLVSGAPVQFGSGQVERWAWEADEHAAVVFCRLKNLELQSQREIAECFCGVVEQPQAPVAVADHFTVDVEHTSATGTGEAPFCKRLRRPVEQRSEARLRLRTEYRIRPGKHA